MNALCLKNLENFKLKIELYLFLSFQSFFKKYFIRS